MEAYGFLALSIAVMIGICIYEFKRNAKISKELDERTLERDNEIKDVKVASRPASDVDELLDRMRNDK